MKRFGLSLAAGVALLALGQSVWAADADVFSAASLKTVGEIQAKALAGSGAYGFIESLTVRVGPRPAGSAAAQQSHDWAAARFKELGLANIKVEPFTVDGWERGDERASITAPVAQHLHVTALGHSVATPAEGLTAPVVRFGSLEELNAAPDGSLKGKIAFIDKKMTRLQDGGGYGEAVVVRVKGPEAASRKGAVGVLIRSTGTDSHRLPHTGLTSFSDGVAPIPAGALSNPDADQLTRVLALGQPVSVNMALATKALGPLSDANVVAEIKGRELPDEIVVIGAHLDSWDLGTGALDDGAGAGIVLATAKIIKSLPQAPRRTIRFVLFGAEEVGIVGAQAYAKQHAAELPKHQAATESDFGGGPVVTFNAGFRPEAKPVADAIGRVLAPLGVVPGHGSSNGGPDVGPMAAQGVATGGLGLDGTDYFDYHHTADDTLDKVDPKKLDQAVAAFASFVWMASESPMALGPVPKK